MQSKIVFTDNGVDKALTGEILGEDEFFVKMKSKDREYRIGKRNIICVKQCKGEENELYPRTC